MSPALLLLSLAPPTLWVASLGIVSLVRRRPVPAAMRSHRLAVWSYTGTYCVVWTAVIMIVSLWPAANGR